MYADSLVRLNVWYDELPEPQRFFVCPLVLVIAGTINMAWTISYGYPFGLLFLLALLALVAIRMPYTSGRLKFQEHAAERVPTLEHQPKLAHPGFESAVALPAVESEPVRAPAAQPDRVARAAPLVSEKPAWQHEAPPVEAPATREAVPVPPAAPVVAEKPAWEHAVAAAEPPAKPVEALVSAPLEAIAPSNPVVSTKPLTPVKPVAAAAPPAVQAEIVRSRGSEKPSGKRGAPKGGRRKPTSK